MTVTEDHKISFAFCMFLVVVVLRYDDAACVGVCTYFFSTGAGAWPSSAEHQQREKDPSEDMIKPSGAQDRVFFCVSCSSRLRWR